ncbi:MarR family winged helix-turn-helix transcriptional regulator [Streptomyces sp. NPDC089919]|uniref:MarR family winged helix-turn-helix transcriptional regulator n=1 Tax=Streptomyces sp. NPDC089919 TaxID=3155188 RepID=UPI00342555AF
MDLLSHAFGVHYGDLAAATAQVGLTTSQANTLSVLRGGPAPMRSLAAVLACDASNVTGLVDRLEKRGLVRREPSPVDRRVKNVVLTAEGERTTEEVRGLMATTRAGLGALSGEDREELLRLLTAVFGERSGGAAG